MGFRSLTEITLEIIRWRRLPWKRGAFHSQYKWGSRVFHRDKGPGLGPGTVLQSDWRLSLKIIASVSHTYVQISLKATVGMKENEIKEITHLCKIHIQVEERKSTACKREAVPSNHSCLLQNQASCLALPLCSLHFILDPELSSTPISLLLICHWNVLWLSPLFKFSCISLFSDLDFCSSFFCDVPKLQHAAPVQLSCLTSRTSRKLSFFYSQIILRISVSNPIYLSHYKSIAQFGISTYLLWPIPSLLISFFFKKNEKSLLFRKFSSIWNGFSVYCHIT